MQQPAWIDQLQDRPVGCFILDPPMDPQQDMSNSSQHWSLTDIMKTVNVIDQSFHNEYSIILYSLYSMIEVQAALKEAPIANGSRLTVSRFIIVKVTFFMLCYFARLSSNIVFCAFKLTALLSRGLLHAPLCFVPYRIVARQVAAVRDPTPLPTSFKM